MRTEKSDFPVIDRYYLTLSFFLGDCKQCSAGLNLFLRADDRSLAGIGFEPVDGGALAANAIKIAIAGLSPQGILHGTPYPS